METMGLSGASWLEMQLRTRTLNQVHQTIEKSLACYVPDTVALRDASSGLAISVAMR